MAKRKRKNRAVLEHATLMKYSAMPGSPEVIEGGSSPPLRPRVHWPWFALWAWLGRRIGGPHEDFWRLRWANQQAQIAAQGIIIGELHKHVRHVSDLWFAMKRDMERLEQRLRKAGHGKRRRPR